MAIISLKSIYRNKNIYWNNLLKYLKNYKIFANSENK